MSEHLRALALAAPECEAKEIARHPLWDDEHCEKAAAELLRLCTQVGALNAEIADHEKAYGLLFKENAELRKDAERLDWMIFNSGRVHHASDGDFCCVRWFTDENDGQTKAFGNARDAIDAAKGESNAD